VLAERLAKRATTPSPAQAMAPKPVSSFTVAYLEVAAHYGVKLRSVEQEGAVTLCYDGDAYKRVLQFSKDAARRARATLALVRDDCVEAELKPSERAALDQARAELLQGIDAAALPATLRSRVLSQRAGLAALVAYAHSRKGDANAAAQSAKRAQADFMLANKADLPEDDMAAFHTAAMRVNASRWALLPNVGSFEPASAKGLSVTIEAQPAGDTCITLRGAQVGQSPLRQCTYGVVWGNSLTINREGTAIALAVQPLGAWRELWVFRKGPEGWKHAVLPPALGHANTGYAEFAGWVPGGTQLLVAREARVEGKYKRSFEVVQIATLATERQSSDPDALGPFKRWKDAAWVQGTVSTH
jgi:hypothetical protein